MAIGQVSLPNATMQVSFENVRQNHARVAADAAYEAAQVSKKTMETLGEIYLKAQQVQLAALQSNVHSSMGSVIDTYA